MSLREKTLNGAKWSAIATVIIIGLGLIQMTVMARIIDNHQFGLLTVSLLIIALADALSDFGIAIPIIQRKEIGYVELKCFKVGSYVIPFSLDAHCSGGSLGR